MKKDSESKKEGKEKKIDLEKKRERAWTFINQKNNNKNGRRRKGEKNVGHF
jgi:5-hydroxyisourate hydrolase-like protein (transthyretin family)